LHVLVTGAGGFLGRYIAEQSLARGDRVRGLARGEYPQLADLGVEMIRGDLRDAETVIRACHGVDVVYHVAAIAGIWGPWQTFYAINTLGTRHVIAACRKHQVGRLVFTSSPSVTFDGRDQNGIDESAPYPQRWLCHYPHTKALAEQDVLAADHPGELLTCALRPHLIWGPRDENLIPRLIDRARSGKLRRVGDGTNLVDITYVENAAEAHLQAADALADNSPVHGRTYFISQGQPVNCWDWINEVLALAGLAPITKSISAGAAYRIGAAMEGIWTLLRRHDEPRMTRFLSTQLSTSHYFDLTAAREHFGYQPSISLPEGMKRLAAEISPQ
jgi:nucleoside-diphosphate-sugar epimerase